MNATTRTCDFTVIGAGSFGAWTAHHLRRSGGRVMLLDAYGPANSRASSGGETRVIRMTYGPDEIYTIWSSRSLSLWQELAERTKQELFHRTGVLWLSQQDDPYTRQAIALLQKHAIACEELTAAEIAARYSQFSFPLMTLGVWEPESGLLLARQAVQARVQEDMRAGMEFIQDSVLPPEQSGNKLQTLRTISGNSVAAGTYIFACGPWLPKVFPEALSGRIGATRQEVFFFGPPAGDDRFRPPKMPVWLQHTHPARPYALPDIEGRGFKIAFDRHGSEFDPDTGSRTISPESVSEMRTYLKEHVPALYAAPIVETRVCQYENTSNGDFLIDRHPEFENVWLVGGGSGHGFKHGPALGEYVTSQILDHTPAEPRFSLSSKQTTRMRAVY